MVNRILFLFLIVLQILVQNLIECTTTTTSACNSHIVELNAINSSSSSTQDLPIASSKNILKYSTINFNNSILKRTKRSVISVERHVELLVVLDSSMLDYHGKDLEKYVLTQMAMVAHIFRHPTVGHSINLKIVSITMLDDEEDNIIYDTPHLLLRSFCLWQNTQNHPSDRSLLHHDTAMLLTRKKLCGSLKPCSMVGLANVAQICNPENSCFIVEDTGLNAAFTIAHELGHVLGIPHDDQEHCNRFYEDKRKRKPKYQRPKIGHIMASVQTTISRIWAWSSCSRHFITKHLSQDGKCLLEDQDHPIRYDPSHRFAGRFYSVDEQCILRFGKTGSTGACKAVNAEVCSRLWCAHPKGGCISDNSPWADGTACKGVGMWCYQGDCVRMSESMVVVDGRWGEWGEWSKCSKPCGGGRQESKRKCNRPKPKNGGHYCLGQRVRSRSCNTQPCSKKKTLKAKKVNVLSERKSGTSKKDERRKEMKKATNNKEKSKLKLKSASEEWFRF